MHHKEWVPKSMTVCMSYNSVVGFQLTFINYEKSLLTKVGEIQVNPMVGLRTDECYTYYMSKNNYFINFEWDIVNLENLMSITLASFVGKKYFFGNEIFSSKVLDDNNNAKGYKLSGLDGCTGTDNNILSFRVFGTKETLVPPHTVVTPPPKYSAKSLKTAIKDFRTKFYNAIKNVETVNSQSIATAIAATSSE